MVWGLTSYLYGGIDPGLEGAVALITYWGDVVLLADTPVLKIQVGKSIKSEYNETAMSNLFTNEGIIRIQRVVIEDVHAMPGQGVVSVFRFGVGYGLWRGILTAHKISYDRVPPQTWKRVMMEGLGKDKDASLLRAQQLFPTADLHLKKHHGRAEALLMAEYGRMKA